MALSAAANEIGSIHGAPIRSNGVSVPRPVARLVASRSPTPGYKIASVRLRMLGDGLIHDEPGAVVKIVALPAPAFHHFKCGPDLSLAVIQQGELAHGHPMAHGQRMISDERSELFVANWPGDRRPPIALGRSSTNTFLPDSLAASSTRPSVVM